MANTYTSLFTHVIFSTKERKPLINAEWEPRLYEYFRGIARNNKFWIDCCGGTADHVHIRFRLPAELALADAVRLIKGGSSKWINEEFGRFAWQSGYGALSVSPSSAPQVQRYIARQKDTIGGSIPAMNSSRFSERAVWSSRTGMSSDQSPLKGLGVLRGSFPAA